MRASAVTPEPVHWLMYPYLPLGKLTVVAGQMGQAKSLLTLWITAEVTKGGLDRDSSNVILLNAEDDPTDTVRPRLEAAGADLDRVWIETHPDLDVTRLSQTCDELGDVALVVVDPIQAFAPASVNSWKGQDVRRWLEPFRVMAAERELTFLLVQHLNRRADATDPLARIADSQGIAQMARSVLMWGPDPSDPEGDQGLKKVLTRAKGNLARSSASASFEITERVISGGLCAPALVRGEDRRITADEVVADHETRSASEEAAAWLRHVLANGPMDAKEIMRRAGQDGISERTLKRAKIKAGAISEPDRDQNKIRGWTWRLGDQIPIKKDGPLDILDPLGPLAKEAKKANSDKKANVNGRREGPLVPAPEVIR